MNNIFLLQEVLDSIWASAGALVDPDHPGDFNQSLMELGATVCTPKQPSCSKCPVADQCLAFAQVKKFDEENKSKLANKLKFELKDIEDCCKGKITSQDSPPTPKPN